MRIFNDVFIAIFIVMLTLPLVFVDLASDRVSVQENRMLANFPKLSDIKRHPETFIRGFEAWFKDSTGFREQLLALYNVISKNKSYNGIWYTDGLFTYLIGEEGYHYFADVNGSLSLINKFQGKQFLTDDQLTNMAAKLEEVKTYLDNKGIPLVVMFCTDKETVYPEFYPKSIKPGPEPVQLDVITAYLWEHTSVDVFNIRQALLAEKNNYLLYSMTGDLDALIHYNEIGAFFAYRELMKHINVYFPQIIPYELGDIEIEYNKGGMHTVSLKAGITYRRLENSIFNNLNFSDDYFFGRGFGNEAYENIEIDLPVILFLRTSFSGENYIGKYFAQHFGKVIMLHFINMEYIEEYIARFNPDIVVFESVERQLGIFADAVAKIPELP
jgi:hypothetical protein